MRQKQEAAKLFIQAVMHDNTMQDRWVIDEELVGHIHAYGNDRGIHDLNMGVSKK